ncbi:hypothetical protein RB199_27205 [Streptomyces libani]
MRRLRVLLDEMTIAYRESRAAALTLDAAHDGFRLASTWLDEAESMTKTADLTLEDDGTVTVPDRDYPQNDPDAAGAARADQDNAEAVHTRAEAALTYAAEVDFHVANELERVKEAIQTGWQGFNATSDPDWYHAVGACHYNTVAQVEVVPGPDGEPQTKIKYQVHVADRYNWDGSEGKSTEVPQLGVVTDKDMGKLHAAGLAKEFDMGGQSSVRTWEG